MVPLLRIALTLAIALVAIIASITGFDGAQNPAAERGVAIIGCVIIAFSGAFALFGVYLGLRSSRDQAAGAWRPLTVRSKRRSDRPPEKRAS